LDGLSSVSATAIYKAFELNFAKAGNELENLWDATRTDLQEIANTGVPHTGPWWAAKVLQFQYDAVTPYYLVWDAATSSFVYNVVDETKRIVTRVAVNELAGGGFQIKVAKGSPTPTALATAEANALLAYIQRIKAVGTFPQLVNLPPDELGLYIEVKYDGTVAVGVVRPLVEQAINTYIASLDFDGVLRWSKIIDAIQAVGVVIKDANFNSATLNGAPFSRETTFPAGHAVIAAGTPLVTTVTYVPL
jgi:hypothetical protein